MEKIEPFERAPLWTRIKLFIGNICFKIFLWSNKETPESYANYIYQSEKEKRSPRWIHERRNGKTTLLVANAMVRLLETGSCEYTDEARPNITHIYYKAHVVPLMKNALYGILGQRRWVDELFKWKFIYSDKGQILLGIRFDVTEKQKYL